jgi:hypothetical protein
MARALFRTVAVVPASVALLVTACQPSRKPDLPDPDVDLGLGSVVLLTFATRAAEGILGHALKSGTVAGAGLDPHRKPISGQPREVQTSQHLRLVVRVVEDVGLGGGYGPAHAHVAASRATHIAYDVKLTSYLEYTPTELRYDPHSGCCVGGTRSEACGPLYVTRLFRGSGSTQLLTEVDGRASVQAGDILEASGGRSFRKLSESSFEDAYFGYEFEDLDPLCAGLNPEQEMPMLEVPAEKNCYLTRYTNQGKREQLSWTLPDLELCTVVVEKACKDARGAVRCEARFRKPMTEVAPGQATRLSDESSMVPIPLVPSESVDSCVSSPPGAPLPAPAEHMHDRAEPMPAPTEAETKP